MWGAFRFRRVEGGGFGFVEGARATTECFQDADAGGVEGIQCDAEGYNLHNPFRHRKAREKNYNRFRLGGGGYPCRHASRNNLESKRGKLMKYLKALSNFLSTPIEELLIRCGAADTVIYEMRAGDEPREGTGTWQWPDDIERASFVITGAGAGGKPVLILKSRLLKRAAPPTTGFQVDGHRFLLYHHYAIDIDIADDAALINLNTILFEAGYDEPSDFPSGPVLWERLPAADDKPQPTEQTTRFSCAECPRRET